MTPAQHAPVDLRELANRIAHRQDQTSFEQMKRELGGYFTRGLESELSEWTWRMRYGMPMSIEAHAYRKLVRMLIRRQRRTYRAVAGARNTR